MRFYLGTHQPHWLGQTSVDLFVSRSRLAGRKSVLSPCAPYGLDSGAFTEISRHGCWTVTPEVFVEQVRHCRRIAPSMEWAAPMDWMCEPSILSLTGLQVRDHQRRTVLNYIYLLRIAPDIPWIPVLQGWSIRDYLSCLALYRAEGIELDQKAVVGVGTICRRQATHEIRVVLQALSWHGLRLHGFGVKTRGIALSQEYLVSADSMSWSYGARRDDPLPGHEVRHRNCANCLEYALRWRERIVRKLDTDGPLLMETISENEGAR